MPDRHPLLRAGVCAAGLIVTVLLGVGCAGSALAQRAAVRSEAAPTLHPPLATWLRAAGLSGDQVGAVVAALPDGAPAFEHNGARAFNPASTMKLLTSYAALSMLGADYRWRTGAYLRGRLMGDVLEGDLVLKGAGDPKLVVEDLTEFAARMRRAGLRELRGDLVIDDSLFDAGDDTPERFDGEPSQPYNVLPHPLLMNFKSARVVIQPQADRVALALDPPLADVQIDNQVQLVGGPCRHGAQGLLVRDVPAGGEAAGSPGVKVRVSGLYSAGCGEQAVYAAVLGHREYIHAVFKTIWQAAGGLFSGQTRLQRGGAQGQPWLEWVSPRSLADVVVDINKLSNNVMSRNLLLQLGADAARPGGAERAREAMSRWLQTAGLAFPELVLENGSGLSRRERLSSFSLAALLRHAAASPVADLLRLSLPLVGVDGTMKRRLVSDPVAGNAWMKTGSLNEVRAIAGYVHAASGRRYAVVLLINGPRADQAAGVQDQLLRWVYAHG